MFCKMKIDIPEIDNLDNAEEWIILIVYIIIGVVVYMLLSTLYSVLLLPVRVYDCCKAICKCFSVKSYVEVQES